MGVLHKMKEGERKDVFKADVHVDKERLAL